MNRKIILIIVLILICTIISVLYLMVDFGDVSGTPNVSCDLNLNIFLVETQNHKLNYDEEDVIGIIKGAQEIWKPYNVSFYRPIYNFTKLNETNGIGDHVFNFKNDDQLILELSKVSGANASGNTVLIFFLEKFGSGNEGYSSPSFPNIILLGENSCGDKSWNMAHEIGHVMNIDHPNKIKEDCKYNLMTKTGCISLCFSKRYQSRILNQTQLDGIRCLK